MQKTMMSTTSGRSKAFGLEESTANMSYTSLVGKPSPLNKKLSNERVHLASAISNHNSLINQKFKLLEDEIMSLDEVSLGQ